jgi:hypothetical protein
MATVSSVVCPSHRIAILMSAHGRFLECQNCLLRVQFAAGSHYEVIAKQFESHSCSSPIPSEGDAPSRLIKIGQCRKVARASRGEQRSEGELWIPVSG